MSNDPNKPPAKTILGWMPNQTPGAPGQVPGQQPGGAPPAQQWGQQPPAPQMPQQPPQQPWGQQPPAPQPQWGQQPPAPQMPQQPPQQQWGQPPAPAPQPQQQWGAPPQQAAQPWGQQPAAPAPQPQQQWGAPPQQAAQPWGGQPQQAAQPWGGQPQQQAQQPQQQASQPWQQAGNAAGGFGGSGMPGFGSLGSAASAAMSGGGTAQSSGNRAIGNADATVGMSDRLRFIRLTYLHLFGAILAFAALEWALFKVPFLRDNVSAKFVDFALSGRWNWGVVLGVFMVVSWVADYAARHATSRPLQYAGLGLYVIAEALIFVPLLAVVQWKTAEIVAKGGGDPNIVRDAAFITLGIFGALTASVFISKKDFSFMRSGLAIASAGAMMLIILSLIFGFNLGIVFAFAMVFLSAGYILYQTSQVMAHYDPQSYPAAALALFSSVALMFWYVIQIVMKMRE